MFIRFQYRARALLLAGLIGVVSVTAATPLDAAGPRNDAQPMPDLTKSGKRDETHDWTLGPTGARGWIYSALGQTIDARQILVTAVAKGSPADGQLRENDVILGIDGKQFAGDARIELARAIAAAEARADGLLTLTRWRDGKSEAVRLKLVVMGPYADTAPYNCPKSAKIFDLGCKAIAARGLKDVSIPNDLNALALLASGRPEYRTALADYAKKVAAIDSKGFKSWYYGYANTFLAEYIMATGDRAPFDGMKRIAIDVARGQSSVGTWGHDFAMPTGGLNGYGCMNQPGISLTISLVLAREAGVKDPAVDVAISKASSFLRWYVDKGAIPYGDHEPFPAHEDNGKCAAAAVLFDLLGDRDAALFFSKMAAAAYSERERGHTGNYFNVLWALPGVARCGPTVTAAYLKEDAWYYDLCRGYDGAVKYQGPPAGEEEHGKYTQWDCTGSYLLGFALPLKSLRLTGKKGFIVPALDKAQSDSVIAAGRDFYPVNGQSRYDLRPIEHLLAGLTSWSPAVRKRSAEALGRRKVDVVPALLKMLSSTDRDTRYGACEALGKLGPAADSAAPQLRKLLNDPDPWLQSLAARALPALGPEARKAAVPDLLAMSVRISPADPRRMAQRSACIALFAPYPGTSGKSPRSILADSLDGVDRKLLYPAMRSALQNPDSVARGSLSKAYEKLSDEDLIALLPDILQAIEKLAPSNEMFGDGIRLAGLDLLSRLHIREAMPLCVSIIEPARWGTGKRMPKCLESLERYGVHAQSLLPQLQAVRQSILDSSRGKEQAEHLKVLDNAITRIKANSESPTLLGIGEFTGRTKGK